MDRKDFLEFLFQTLNGLSDLLFIVEVNEFDDFYYFFINEAAQKVTGISSESYGKPIRDYLSFSTYSLIEEKYREAIQQQRPISYEDKMKVSNSKNTEKKTIYYETNVTPIINKHGKCTHIVASVRDITERKKMINKIKEKEERYRIITENTTDLIKVIDTEGKILFASPSHTRVTGEDPRESLNKLITSYIYSEDRKIFRKRLKKLSKRVNNNRLGIDVKI